MKGRRPEHSDIRTVRWDDHILEAIAETLGDHRALLDIERGLPYEKAHPIAERALTVDGSGG